eukprot:6485422-Amphidinium_carterae.1
MSTHMQSPTIIMQDMPAGTRAHEHINKQVLSDAPPKHTDPKGAGNHTKLSAHSKAKAKVAAKLTQVSPGTASARRRSNCSSQRAKNTNSVETKTGPTLQCTPRASRSTSLNSQIPLRQAQGVICRSSSVENPPT